MNDQQLIASKIKRNSIKGYVISLITAPFVPILIIKLLYSAPGNNVVSTAVKDIISEAFQLSYVAFMWPITPSVTIQNPLALTNFVGAGIFILFITGMFLIGEAKRAKRLRQHAQQEAERLDLIDHYRRK